MGMSHNMTAVRCLITRSTEHRILGLSSIHRDWLRRWVVYYDEHVAASTEGRRGESRDRFHEVFSSLMKRTSHFSITRSIN